MYLTISGQLNKIESIFPNYITSSDSASIYLWCYSYVASICMVHLDQELISFSYLYLGSQPRYWLND